MRTHCQPAIQAWELRFAKLIATPPEVDLDDPTVLCRDDRCPRLNPHLAHVIMDAVDDATVYDKTDLTDLTYRHVMDREVRSTGQIYHSVCDDYGYLNYRTVQDCLFALAMRREVILVMPRHTRRKLSDPSALNRSGGAGSLGAWVRYSSPLLFDRDGFEILSSQVEEMTIDWRRRSKFPARRGPKMRRPNACAPVVEELPCP